MNESVLAGRMARFWLSESGKIALREIVNKEAFSAYVQAAEIQGAWILLGGTKTKAEWTGSLLLLKWEYVAAAQVEMLRETSPTPEHIQ